MPVATGVIGDLGMAALLVLAARDMAAERRGAAVLDRRHHLELAETDMAGIGPAPRRAVVAEDVRDLQRWTRHARRASSGRLDLLNLTGDMLQRADDLLDRLGGDARVERRGVEFGMPEQSCAIIRILLSH